MILRRVIEHFRTQEWTAIAIDFVIVVLGVFVGIQVSNWNAERELRASEMSHMAQLRDEIVTNVRLLEAHQSYTREVVEAGRRALAFLENDAPCADNAPIFSSTSFTRRSSGEHLIHARGTKRMCGSAFRRTKRRGPKSSCFISTWPAGIRSTCLRRLFGRNCAGT